MSVNIQPLIENTEQTIHFIMEREKTQGGFGSSPELPATLQDTFFAVKALKILGINIQQKEISDFINKKITEFKDNPILLNLAMEILKDKLPQINTTKLFTQKIEKITNLQNINAIALIAKFVKNYTLLSELQEKTKKIITSNMILEDIYYVYSIMGKKNFPDTFLKYIINSQSCDGGFGFKPDTTSFVENAYFAVKILENYPYSFPKNPGLLKSFLISCYRKDGGFSRAPGGASFLESTYYSLYVLNYLSFNKA